MTDLEESLGLVSTLNVTEIAHADTISRTIRYGMYQESLTPKIVAFVNKQLSVAVTRDKGFEVLCKILPDCSTKVLQQNCSTWANFALSHHPNEPVPGRRLQVLAELIVMCHSFQEFHKIIVSSLLSKTVESCVSIHPKSSNSWYALECLIQCLKYYPSTCIVYKKKLEVFLLQFLDTPATTSVLQHAATSFHYLNQIGGGGTSGITHVNNYSDCQEKLCNTLNHLYDDLFENLDEYCEQIENRSNIHEFKKVQSNMSRNETLRILGRRLRNVTAFLMKTFECSYSVKKCIKPELFIQTIQRGLATHVHVGDKDLDNVLLSVVIQKHQIDLLLLLKTVVKSLGQNFIRFSTVKVLLDYLTRTKNCECFSWNSEYKVVIYEVLHYWILNSGEYLDSVTYEKMMEHIIDDITPIKNSLTLNVKKVEYNKSKKSKTVEIIQEIGKENMPLRKKEFKEEICYQALVTLELLFKKILLTVKENTCIVLFETITKNLLNINVNIYEIPYSSKKCRLMLYKALIAVFDQHKSLDIGLTVNILALGQCSLDFEVGNICSEGLANLEKICQPTHLPLQLAFEKSDSESERVVNGESHKRKYIEITSSNSEVSAVITEVKSPELQLELTAESVVGTEIDQNLGMDIENEDLECKDVPVETEIINSITKADICEKSVALESKCVDNINDNNKPTDSKNVEVTPSKKIKLLQSVDITKCNLETVESIKDNDAVDKQVDENKKIKSLESVNISDCIQDEDMLLSFVDEVV